MSQVLITESNLTNIADAIRSKNGTTTKYTPAEMATAISNIPSGGGGASNFVTGTFTPTAESGTESIQIPYTGTGYPIMAIVVVEGGAYNPDNTEWYDLVSRYAIGMWCMTKSVMGSAPTEGNVNTRMAVIASIYKSSASSATTYTRYSQMNVDVYTSQPRSTNAYPITFYDGSDNHVLAYSCTGYGLRSGITYSYLIVYSE